ncbi:CPBP family intramembrane glutamic endopeptidase [Hymenobacter properus]|uniref:CPBP family intramembrane metalloprotease n=1 Tax=Hymenobacter properus TaxID=2791026 RepID=A0A931FJ27_9BACT|nr:CPBP family intramembrane glutamic endopeptidase [Hymenobacter properus]MBF9142587.1 CPBP family intramembrane metalloprotease [Hymenobacter properus]MBR7721395.1 CPBP family intramembrane metalloprotease [Microvirga sp. SRT04]
MIGILVELVLSWLLLRLVASRSLAALGLWPDKVRGLELIAGMLMAGLVCAAYHAAMYLAGNGWALNPAYTAAAFARSSFWVLKSVLYETLIFQGALLYLAVQRLGTAKACLLSAACFGVYHWFSYGAFGNPVQMAFIFFMTAITGLMYAQAFAQTGSLYLPIGLHFGWNLTHIVVFSAGPLGPQLLVPANQHRLQDMLSLVVFLFQVLALPAIAYLYLKRRRQPLAPRAA